MALPFHRSNVSLFRAAISAPVMCLAISAPALADIVINEVESQPTDFVELYNTGAAPVDIGGYQVNDNNPNSPTTIPFGTIIPGAGYYVVTNPPGLGNPDEVHLFNSLGTPLEVFGWEDHAATTFGRCPDGTGALVVTVAGTPGAANSCLAPPTGPWPGSASVSGVDQLNVLLSDVSGLDYEGSGGTTPGVLWVVRNSTGTLFRLIWDGSQWVRDTGNGWSGGKDPAISRRIWDSRFRGRYADKCRRNRRSLRRLGAR